LAGNEVVTIGIPTYNRSGMLRQALESALSQTYPNVEIIVSDNGSPDDTQQVVAQYADPRVACIRQDPPIHPIDNWNCLWREASGEHVVILHDDDYLEPRFCEQLVGLYRKHPDVGLAVSGVYFHRDRQIEESPLSGTEVEEGYNLVRDFFEWRRTVHLCCLMFRTDDLRRIGGFSTEYKFSQDCSAWVPLCMQGRIAHAREHLAHYRLHEGSGTHSIGILPRVEDHLALAELCVQLAEKRGLDRSVVRMLRQVGWRNVGRTAARYALEQAESGLGKREVMRKVRLFHRYILSDWKDAVPRTLLAYMMPAPVVRCLRASNEKRKYGDDTARR
jgi:glycosyltransferase involved in cell wall biosynthesis